jgi:hypothetical protein
MIAQGGNLVSCSYKQQYIFGMLTRPVEVLQSPQNLLSAILAESGIQHLPTEGGPKQSARPSLEYGVAQRDGAERLSVQLRSNVPLEFRLNIWVRHRACRRKQVGGGTFLARGS